VKRLALALVVLGAACGGSDDSSGQRDGGPITVGEVWARATVDAAATGAVYVELTADADDALVGAAVAADIAEGVTLHETVTDHSGHDDDSAMVMMNSVDRLDLPPGELVTLEPGGAHLMLVELAQPLRVGARFALTLKFDVAPDISVQVTVRDG